MKTTTALYVSQGCAFHKRVDLPYIAWHNWADKMNRKGIRQTQCPTCKLWLFPQETGLRLFCDLARHLVCIPYSVENLHWMARQLKIKKHWFHKNHYDVPQGMHQSLMESGTVELITPRQILKIIKPELIAV